MSVDVLLELWRSTKSPRIAALVEFASPLVVPPLPKKLPAALAFVEPLLAAPDDPRVAAALMTYVEGNKLVTDAGIELTYRAIERVGAIGDIRQLPRIAAQLALKKMPARFVQHAAAIAALQEVVVVEPEAALVAELEAKYRPNVAAAADRAANEDGFVAAIHASPDSIGPIEVYADWLQQHQDPRGEFIALQLAATKTPKGETREKKLLAEHGAKWIGPIAKWFRTEDRCWENGFFAGGKLRDGYVDEMLASPGWPMIRVLEVSTSLETLVAKLLERPELASLRALGVISEPFAEQLASAGDPLWLEELHWICRDDGDRGGSLATFAGLPKIATLAPWGSTAHILPWVTRAAVIERAKRLIVNAHEAIATVRAVAARGGTLREIEFGAGRFGKRAGWTIRITRAKAPGPFTKIHAKWTGAKGEMAQFAYTLQQTLLAIPDGASLEFEARSMIDLSPEQVAMCEAAVARFAPTSRPWL